MSRKSLPEIVQISSYLFVLKQEKENFCYKILRPKISQRDLNFGGIQLKVEIEIIICRVLYEKDYK